ncbi:MAG TPA: condensation domain-containing protein, partial [Bryobacteraceae bacterium]|nr:condensation domain-containing protein [Bryobacteraceae bacterium]
MCIPLSPAQRRVWILHQLDPSSPASNRPLAVRLTGGLDSAVLRRVLDEIARRHESLRTIFPSEAGQPCQVVLPPAPVAFEYSDLQRLDAESREEEARRLASARAREPFDLERGPLLRAILLHLDEREHVLLVLMHHIVFDGWSENILLYELKTLYRAFSRDAASPLPELTIQYQEYARRETARVERGELDGQLQYWRRQLADPPPEIALPVAKEAGGAVDGQGSACSLLLPPDLTRSLKLLGRQERATLFMTMLAAFQLLLARYSRQQDIVVGVPVAGRNGVEVEKLIGCFLNVVAFRARLSGEPTVHEWLARSRQTALEAYANQEVPFEGVVQELAPARSPERWPLFQVMFQLRNFPAGDAVEAADFRVEPYELETDLAGGLDLNLEVRELNRGLSCRLSYNRASFERAAVERMLEHYRNLLEAFVQRPEESVWTLPMLSEPERRQLLVEWNDTRVDWPGDPCAHHLFEEQERKSPDAVALVSGDVALTYRELNRRANRLARRLIGLGAGPDTLIAICVERSPEMIIGHLGILKAGAAYLPLDPAHPLERRLNVLSDAKPLVLLARRSREPELAAAVPAVLLVDSDETPLSEQDDENPAAQVTAENLAYVIYTSGSTGVPKGVLVRHRSLCNYLQCKQQRMPLMDRDVHLQRSALTFDDAVWEYLQAFMVGARVVQARAGGEAEGAYLVDLVARHKVTVATMVASQLAMFLAEPGVERCVSLRRMTSGGEVLAPAVVERFFEVFCAELHNGYGPAETTITSTFHQCRPGDCAAGVPIGRPIANTEIYILDGHLQPVPVGV